MDSYELAPGSIAARMRDLGIRSRVGAPTIVDDRVWVWPSSAQGERGRRVVSAALDFSTGQQESEDCR
jgi:hypothetical protein